MDIKYCDLCTVPIKKGEQWVLYLSSPTAPGWDYNKSYVDNLANVEKGCKEICPTCKHIFDKMFQLRLQRLYELTEEINQIYDAPTKKNPKERKNGKEKK